MSGILYVTGTPIGNLGDFSPRAAETLESVDFIAAEDTRVTLKLLNHFGIKKPMVSYFEHNKRERGEIICNRIEQGENCAIVTDAGMPCISDPGEDLVRICYEQGIEVTSLPGAAACITALTMSGLPTRRFAFEAFLPRDKKERARVLEELAQESRTMIVYEAPHHLLKTLKELYEVLGNRELTVCKELTKRYENATKTTFEDVIRFYEDNEPKGEYLSLIHI